MLALGVQFLTALSNLGTEKLSKFLSDRCTQPPTAVQFCHFWPNFWAKIWGGRSLNFQHHPRGPGRPYSDGNARKLADTHRMSGDGWWLSLAHCAKAHFILHIVQNHNCIITMQNHIAIAHCTCAKPHYTLQRHIAHFKTTLHIVQKTISEGISLSFSVKTHCWTCKLSNPSLRVRSDLDRWFQESL